MRVYDQIIYIPAPAFDGGLKEDDGVDGIHDADLGVPHEFGVALTSHWSGGILYQIRK